MGDTNIENINRPCFLSVSLKIFLATTILTLATLLYDIHILILYEMTSF